MMKVIESRLLKKMYFGIVQNLSISRISDCILNKLVQTHKFMKELEDFFNIDDYM